MRLSPAMQHHLKWLDQVIGDPKVRAADRKIRPIAKFTYAANRITYEALERRGLVAASTRNRYIKITRLGYEVLKKLN